MRLSKDGTCPVHFCVWPQGHAVCDFVAQWIEDAMKVLEKVDSDEARELLRRDNM